MREVSFELTGTTPLLMHRDDVDAADRLEEWRKAPENSGKSKAGDDRSPAWTWQTYLYTDGEKVVMPAENIMVALRWAGAKITLKRQTTLKQLSQSGLLIRDEMCEFTYGPDQRTLRVDQVPDIDLPHKQQAEIVDRLGFSLFVKRATIGTSKHVRVRPRFNQWRVRGTVLVLSDDLTQERLAMLFQIAERAGLCDWRPSSPKSPGPFGQFEAKLK